MTKPLKDELNEYISNIRKQLVCNAADKKRLLSDLTFNIDEFIEDHPESSINDIIEHFGTPEDIAGGYLSSLEGGELNNKLKKTKKIRKCILFACGIIVFILVCIFIFEYLDSRNFVNGYEEIVVNQSVES